MAKKTARAQAATPRSMKKGVPRAVTRVRARGRWKFTSCPHSVQSPLQRIRQHKAAARGIEIEQLRVTAPGDCGFNLPLAFLLTELLVEHVEEEIFAYGVVAFGVESAANLAQQQHILDGGVAEEFFLAKNFGVGKL